MRQLLLLLVAPGALVAQVPAAKLDPRLRPFTDPRVASRVARAPTVEAARPLLPLPVADALALRRVPGRPELFVDVWVSLTEPTPSAVEAVGGRVRARAGSLIGAQVPLSALAALDADPRVRYVRAAQRLKPINDLAMSDIRVTGARSRSGGQFFGATGRGVIFGLVDTGIDWTHGDFKHPGGSTRILYIWDLTSGFGTPPGVVGGQNFDRGNECDAAEINAGACSQRDVAAHGTHVAGIGAGDGSAGSAFAYTGVAPGVDIIMVKGGDQSFSDVDVVEGVQYIFKRVEVLGRPAVVNLSLSSAQFGPHDGTSPMEQAIDSLSGPGRIVVVAAGNDGSNPTATTNNSPIYLVHATRTLPQGASAPLTVTVNFYSPQSGEQNDFMLFNMWYDRRDTLTITVTRPNGTFFSRRTGQPPDSADDVQGRIYIDNASLGPSSENGDHEAEIQIYDGIASQFPAPGTWTITVRLDHLGGTTGRFDVWQYLQSETLFAANAQIANGDNAYVVGTPGSAARAITVGAHVNRVQWQSRAGGFQFFVREQVGDLATFSSSGPTRPVRDSLPERQKPELTAPGKGVFSAYSSMAAPPAPEPLIATDGVHLLLSGTSMASPMVAGAIALLLERKPDLTPEEARDILTRRARQDAFTGSSYAGFGAGVPNPSWGYGKLDVQAALAEIPTVITAEIGAASPTGGGTRIGQNTMIQFEVAAVTGQDVRLDSIQVNGGSTGDLGQLIAELALYRDVAGTGVVPNEPPLAVLTGPFAGASFLRFRDLNATIPAGKQAAFLLVARVTDRLRQGDTRGLSLFPIQGTDPVTSQTVTAVAPAPVASRLGPGSLLEPGEGILVSENPVRDGRVIFSYAATANSIALYNFAGLKVREFTRLPPDRFEWDLRAESPGLPNGMYILVVRHGSEDIERRRLMILSPAR